MHKEKQTAEDLDKPLDYDFDEVGPNDQQNWEDELIRQIDFSDDEENEDDGSLTIKNAAQYLYANPKTNAKKLTGNKVDEQKYFDAIAKWTPNIEKADQLKARRKNLKEEFEKRKNEMQNAFAGDF